MKDSRVIPYNIMNIHTGQCRIGQYHSCSKRKVIESRYLNMFDHRYSPIFSMAPEQINQLSHLRSRKGDSRVLIFRRETDLSCSDASKYDDTHLELRRKEQLKEQQQTERNKQRYETQQKGQFSRNHLQTMMKLPQIQIEQGFGNMKEVEGEGTGGKKTPNFKDIQQHLSTIANEQQKHQSRRGHNTTLENQSNKQYQIYQTNPTSRTNQTHLTNLINSINYTHMTNPSNLTNHSQVTNHSHVTNHSNASRHTNASNHPSMTQINLKLSTAKQFGKKAQKRSPVLPRKFKSRKNQPPQYESLDDYFTASNRKGLQRTLILQSKKQELLRLIPKVQPITLHNMVQAKRSKTFMPVSECAEEEVVASLIHFKNQAERSKSIIQVKPVKNDNKTLLGLLAQDRDSISVYEYKIKIYREFLFMLNLAHRVFDPIVIRDCTLMTKSERIQQIPKYTYYVGKGNNSMLVRSLMKRRIWWVEIDDPNIANFVWTQIKIDYYYQLQRRSQYGSLFDKVDEEAEGQNKRNNQRISTTSSKIQYRPFDIVKGSSFKPPFPDNEEKIFTLIDRRSYNTFQKRTETNDLDNFDARLKYFSKEFLMIPTTPKTEERVHNHFIHNNFLGNKKALFYNLKYYYDLRGKNLWDIIPLTFHIKNSENDNQYQALMAATVKVEQGKGSKTKNVWIVKPGQNSNRGNGIVVVKQLKELKKILRKRDKHTNGDAKTFIVQKYIENPLLYKGRKFDIRHYLLVTRLHGRLRGYFFGQGYIRTSSEQFSLENTDTLVHLTNDAVQKQSQSYGEHEEANKISYNELQKYYTKYYPNKSFSIQKVYTNMKEIARQCIEATYLTLDKEQLEHNFEIYGMDFMIDNQLRVLLIEVNTNPCLELSSTLLARIIPLMADQALRLSLDVIFPPNIHYNNNSKYMAPDCSLSKLQYELIFDEGRDGQKLCELYNPGLATKQYSELISMCENVQQEQQTYDNEGQEIEIDQIVQ